MICLFVCLFVSGARSFHLVFCLVLFSFVLSCLPRLIPSLSLSFIFSRFSFFLFSSLLLFSLHIFFCVLFKCFLIHSRSTCWLSLPVDLLPVYPLIAPLTWFDFPLQSLHLLSFTWLYLLLLPVRSVNFTCVCSLCSSVDCLSHLVNSPFQSFSFSTPVGLYLPCCFSVTCWLMLTWTFPFNTSHLVNFPFLPLPVRFTC